MEELQQEFAAQVAFLFVYTKEAHPDDGPDKRDESTKYGGWRIKSNKVKIDTHKDYAARVKAAKDLKAAGKENWRVAVDDMASTTQNAWGKLPNSAYLIDPTSRIAGKWAWVSAAPIRELLKKQASLKPYSVADDAQLPLRGCAAGWLKYKLEDGAEEVVNFADCAKDSVTREVGDKSEKISLDSFKPPEKPAKVVTRKLKVKDLELPCVVTLKDNVETWMCAWLPGNGVVKIVEKDGKGRVSRTLMDAGFLPRESCLKAYDGDAGQKKPAK